MCSQRFLRCRLLGSYMAKSKAKSLDAKLAKATKWVGAAFIVLTLILNCMVAAGAVK